MQRGFLHLLSLIHIFKPVVPLEGLRLMFSIQEECYPLQTAYDYFCDEFENMLGAEFGVAPVSSTHLDFVQLFP